MTNTVKTFISYPSFPSSPTAGGAIGTTTVAKRRPGSGQKEAIPESDTTKMASSQTDGLLQEFLIIFGLVAVQVSSAIYMVALTPILDSGVKPLFLIIFGCLATCIFVLPFAIAFESKKWPAKLSFKLMSQFVLIALSGVTTFQALMLLGMEKTSPAIASAMPNIAPGIIFIIAACLRFEKIDMNCKYTRAKILGTIICLGGAVTMSFLQAPSESPPDNQNENVSHVGTEWIIGCLYLLGGVLVVSCSTVLQAVTMVSFPAPFSLCSITSFLGTLFSIAVQIMTDGKVDPGTPAINIGSVIAIMLLGGMVIALCVSFQTWAVKKKGPVLVSMFSPVQTVCSALLSAIFLGQVIQVGSVVGMFVMFSGLYMVLWAKNKEGFILPNVSTDDSTQYSSGEDVYDVEKPLLN